jgi:hypothetical protein
VSYRDLYVDDDGRYCRPDMDGDRYHYEDTMTRTASGISPEELFIQDAYMEGQRAGHQGLAAGLNPFNNPKSPEAQAWERGRSAVEAMRLADRVRAAGCVA